MHILRLEFKLTAMDDIFLPYYKGSTFRGAFGHALKKSVCVTEHKACERCPLQTTCAYTYMFETRNARGEQVAHPYVLEPPLSDKRYIERGESFHLSMILIGRATEYVPHVIHAFQEMGNRGVGRENSRFKVSAAYSFRRGEKIYWHGGPDKKEDVADAVVSLSELTPRSGTRVSLHFITVTALKRKGRIVYRPDFDTLIRAAYRRMKALSIYHNGEEIPAYPQGAERVRAAEYALKKAWWRRYSNRQGKYILFDGFVGSIRFEADDLSAFIPLLEMGRHVHIGRGTVYGMGKYELEIN